MRRRFHLALIVAATAVMLLAASAAFGGAPYRWPNDTGGDPENHGDDANGWDYFVDFYWNSDWWIEPMVWCPFDLRWEDPHFTCGEDAGWIGKDNEGWKIVGGGDGDWIVNPKIALHPDINNDLDGKEKKQFKASINMRALPGGASLRIFICDSNGTSDGPDPESNRRDLFGTNDNPIIYGPNEPIQGSWPVTIGEEGSDADMTYCDWLVYEIDDPNQGDDDDGGGGEDDDGDDDDDDDDDFAVFNENRCPLLSEVVAAPDGGQFVEIVNPYDESLPLSDLFLSNSTEYYGVVKQDGTVDTKSGSSGYFNAKFPPNAYISPGERQVVSIVPGDDFVATYGGPPQYLLHTGTGAIMEEAFTGSVADQGDLSKTGEALTLYRWNGISDLVCDCDYALWGDKSNAVDKTGVAIDGIDAGSDESAYADDTPPADQSPIAAAAHEDGKSFNRCDTDEGAEEKSGDNNGCDPDSHDETSEDLENTWLTLSPPTPHEDPSCDDSDDDDTDDDTDDDAQDDDTDDDAQDDDAADDDASGDDDDDDDSACGC